MSSEQVTIRPAVAGDRALLEDMVAVAADWRNEVVTPTAEILAIPSFAHYVEGWPRTGDHGLVAEIDGVGIGAAWWRLLPATDPGYGYLDESTPEVTIGVRPGHRGAGVGRELLTGLVDAARRCGLEALSLSVEHENPARRLYRRVGFDEVATDQGAVTMRLGLRPAGSEPTGLALDH